MLGLHVRARCTLHVASCMLQAACCKLHVASCLLQAARYKLHVACHLSLAPLVRLLLELALGVRNHTLQRNAASHKRSMPALSHCCHGAKAWKPDIYDATCNRQARMGKARSAQDATCAMQHAALRRHSRAVRCCAGAQSMRAGISAGAPRARARLQAAPASASAWLQLQARQLYGS
jgi:hypothetical protein